MGMSASSTHMLSGASVTMIPAMMDKSCGTSSVYNRMTPMRIMMDEMRVMLRNMSCVPDMMMSIWSMQLDMGMFSTWMDMRDACLQMMLMIVECWAMMFCMPMMLYMPGIVSMTMCVALTCCIMILAMPMNGKRVVRCSMPSARGMDEFSDEKWIFVNGAMTRYAMWFINVQLF